MTEPSDFEQFEHRKKAALLARADAATWKESAKAGGVSVGTVCNWRKADTAFALAWQAASDLGTSTAEDCLEACAKKALDDPRYQTSLIFLLKNRRPDTWRDRHDLRHSMDNTGPVKITVEHVEMPVSESIPALEADHG
jgi:hypothetical protein